MELAIAVNDPKAKAILFHMAEVWMRLAELKDPGGAPEDEAALFG